MPELIPVSEQILSAFQSRLETVAVGDPTLKISRNRAAALNDRDVVQVDGTADRSGEDDEYGRWLWDMDVQVLVSLERSSGGDANLEFNVILANITAAIFTPNDDLAGLAEDVQVTGIDRELSRENGVVKLDAAIGFALQFTTLESDLFQKG